MPKTRLFQVLGTFLQSLGSVGRKIGTDLAIYNSDGPMALIGNFLIVSDNDDSLSLLVEI